MDPRVLGIDETHLAVMEVGGSKKALALPKEVKEEKAELHKPSLLEKISSHRAGPEANFFLSGLSGFSSPKPEDD